MPTDVKTTDFESTIKSICRRLFVMGALVALIGSPLPAQSPQSLRVRMSVLNDHSDFIAGVDEGRFTATVSGTPVVISEISERHANDPIFQAPRPCPFLPRNFGNVRNNHFFFSK
jgi:hypothetical protein